MFNRLASGLRTAGALSLMALSPLAAAQSTGNAGPAVNTETFQSWEVNCPVNRADGACSMTQLVDGADGEPSCALLWVTLRSWIAPP